MADKTIEHTEMLKDAPKNWGRWGADDEIGCLNFLTDQEVLRGIKAVKQGKTFMLGVPVARPETVKMATCVLSMNVIRLLAARCLHCLGRLVMTAMTAQLVMVVCLGSVWAVPTIAMKCATTVSTTTGTPWWTVSIQSV